MKTCYIFGAGEGLPRSFKREKEDLVIAADAGIKALSAFDIQPDIAVGDFDSLGFVPRCREIIKHPSAKDDTDMMLAVKTGFERGYKRFMLYGGAGGRPDHTFANYQALAFISARGGIGFLPMGEFTACAVTDSYIEFLPDLSGTLSVFALNGSCKGVYLENLRFSLNDAVVSYDFPIGVSNEFTGKAARVTVKDGTLLVMWQGDSDCVICPKSAKNF